jgi:mannose-6-phosphate isomerase-like protein (cupin superfamily)
MHPVVVAPGEDREITFGVEGPRVMVKASDAETGGLCSVWEGHVGPGLVGAGPHYHVGRDELFYVLEGELVLRIGDSQSVALAGTFAFVPRGTIHGFRNESAADARLLVVHHPAGFERYFDEMLSPLAARASREERAALAARYDLIPVADGIERR